MEEMATCFVMQPFDRDVFDRRYEDVFAPAIRAANLEPYRVDRDPAVSIPINQIESGIRDAAICFAEVTTDNPSVWFELGFAIAEQKEVVLVCSEERETRFPFDIQHRTILKYKTGSPQDFRDVETRVTERLQALLKKVDQLNRAARISPIREVQGLQQHEIVTLVAVAQNLNTPEDAVSVHSIRQDMERSGFTQIATTLGLAALLRKALVASLEVREFGGESYIAYNLTSDGFDWLMANQDQLVLQASKEEDDIPF